MENNEQTYIVKELPNAAYKMEQMLNEMVEQGFEVSFVNDYSVIFKRDKE